MITADDIDTLLFDVLGTVVDEAGSMQAEVATALGQADDSAQAEALAAAWLRRASALVTSICEGSPWRSADDVNAEALAEVLRDGPALPEPAVRHLALAGHRLRPFPDAVAALRPGCRWRMRPASRRRTQSRSARRAGGRARCPQ
jgi:2-haloacid dehalogenase